MKGLLISLGTAAVLAAAMPAAAQSWDGYGRGGYSGGFNGGYGGGFGDRGGIGSIERRIEQGIRDGSLTRNEASRLRDRAQDLRQLEWRYGRDGRISSSEARELDRRYAELNRRLFVERRDNDTRGYGWNDRGYGGGYRGDGRGGWR
jgi:hypothetical protein